MVGYPSAESVTRRELDSLSGLRGGIGSMLMSTRLKIGHATSLDTRNPRAGGWACG